MEELMSEHKNITTADGFQLQIIRLSLTAGPRGPYLLEDFYLLEKLAHFNRERIPERVVHRGSSRLWYVHGYSDITLIVKRKFSQVGKETEVLLRFSTVGSEGSADAERDQGALQLSSILKRQLGSHRKQHTGFLHSRSQVP